MRFIGNLVLLLNSRFGVVFSSRFPEKNLIHFIKTVLERIFSAFVSYVIVTLRMQNKGDLILTAPYKFKRDKNACCVKSFK